MLYDFNMTLVSCGFKGQNVVDRSQRSFRFWRDFYYGSMNTLPWLICDAISIVSHDTLPCPDETAASCARIPGSF